MIGRLISALLVGAGVGTAAMPAFAITCYEVIDRNNVVIFRDVSTPVDLGDRGAAARDAMRSRGELLVIFDAQTCRGTEGATPSGNRTLSTEEIVSGWNSFGNSGFGGAYGSTLPAAGGGAVFAPMPTNPGSTPAAEVSSTRATGAPPGASKPGS